MKEMRKKQKIKKYAITIIKFAIEVAWIVAAARIVIYSIIDSFIPSDVVAQTIAINSIIMIKAGIEQIQEEKDKKAKHFKLFEQQIALTIYYFQGCGQLTPRESQKLIQVVKLAAGNNGWKKQKESESNKKKEDTNQEENK